MNAATPGRPSEETREASISEIEGSSDKAWDLHWVSLGSGRSRSIFGLASSAVRRFIFQPAVHFFLEKYFPPSGTFIEAGCGTGESSVRVPRRDRRFIGIDFSRQALKQAQMATSFDDVLCADLFHLPFRAGTIDGIWNLGVMEHFDRSLLVESLTELRRVLKPGGVVVLFWPPEGNLSRWALGPVEHLRSAITRKPFRFFPEEVSRLKSRQEAIQILEAAGFKVLELDLSARTAFIHMVVVGRNA
jgi:SAM-dependent methyltransferase